MGSHEFEIGPLHYLIRSKCQTFGIIYTSNILAAYGSDDSDDGNDNRDAAADYDHDDVVNL